MPLLSSLLGGQAARAASLRQGSWVFPSAPTLHPPALRVVEPPRAARQRLPKLPPHTYFFLAPIRAVSRKLPFAGAPGPEIVEADGQPVWQLPLGGPLFVDGHYHEEVAMDLHPTTYLGHQALVWWQGYITPEGFGDGTWMIVGPHYETLAEVKAPSGTATDFHSFHLTPGGDVFLLGTKLVQMNLSRFGGPRKGQLFDEIVFELDPRTGKVLWRWDPLHHIPLKQSYAALPKGKPWDPYHLNAIDLGPGGNVIVCARNTWAAYWVSRRNGAVFARLGGKASTFKLGPGVHFAWQHDLRYLAGKGEELSVFADEAAPPEGAQSRALVIGLNWRNHTASLLHAYLLPHPALAGSQGNVELLPDGHLFVGWGQLPYLAEYAPQGKLLYLAELPGSDESYRAFEDRWEGQPTTPPNVVLVPARAGLNVGASWNGATAVVAWQLLTGSSATNLTPTGRPVARQGFETVLHDPARPSYLAVEALGPKGKVVGTSLPLAVPPPS